MIGGKLPIAFRLDGGAKSRMTIGITFARGFIVSIFITIILVLAIFYIESFRELSIKLYIKNKIKLYNTIIIQ